MIVPVMNCPLGIIAGQSGFISLTGCENANQDWISFNPDLTISPVLNGANIFVSSTAANGTAIVTVNCVDPITGDNSTEQCTINLIAADYELTCEESVPVTIDYVECGEVCTCTSITITVGTAGFQNCETRTISGFWKDCSVPDIPEPEILQRIPLVGASPIVLATCNPNDIIDNCCDENWCSTPDVPAFHWKNLCHSEGWTLSADGINNIYNACNCNAGQSYQFQGTTTITATGINPQLIDSVILLGHNMTDATITTSPDQVFGGGPTGVGVYYDDSCLEGFLKPVVLSLNEVNEATNAFSFTIQSNTNDIICIQEIFIGQKFFLPDLYLPQNFINPHDGDDYELEVKNSNCGRLSTSLKHVDVPMSLEISDVTDDWLKTKWRPLLRYMKRHGVLFQHSINNCPNDVFNGWLESAQGGSRQDFCFLNTVSIDAKGRVNQPEVKKFG